MEAPIPAEPDRRPAPRLPVFRRGVRHAVALLSGALWCHAMAAPVEVVLPPAADATIFDGTPSAPLADGTGEYLWSLATGGGLLRRALIRFDLGALPSGAVVTSVELSLYESTPRPRNRPTLTLHRVLAPWTEGPANTGSFGGGAPASAGDVTWWQRVHPVQPWTNPGGDFVTSASGGAQVGSPGSRIRWASTPALVADVQAWIANPTTNHGWILVGSAADEADSLNAKRFDSRESAVVANRPQLRVTYELPEGDVPLPPWALVGLGTLLSAAVLRRVGRSV